MDLAFVKLVLLTGFWVSINAVIESCSLKIALLPKTITAKSMWERSVWDKLACAVACMKDVNCKSLIYTPSKKTCLGYPMATDYYQNQMADVREDNFMSTTCRVSVSVPVEDIANHHHGRQCRQNNECGSQDSICCGGVCLCRAGLYFSPTQNSCLKKCDVFGDKMDYYRGLSITGHNDKKMFVSLERCMEACVQEKNFTCLTVDWWPADHSCFLSASGYLDAEEKDRSYGSEWGLAQRQCRSLRNKQSQNTDLGLGSTSTIPHGQPCSRNDECSVQESVCYDGLCLCRLGLYFSPTQNACLKECDDHDEEMDYYRGGRFKGPKNKMLVFIPLLKCMEACVQEKTFTCLILNWRIAGSMCYLSASGYMDIDEKGKRYDTSCGVAQRRCK